MTFSRLWHAWDQFWFGEGSPLPLALFRIAIGIITLEAFILLRPDCATLFGQNAIVSPASSAAWLGGQELDVLSLFPGNDMWLSGMINLLAVAGVCLALGLFSRLSAALVYLLILSLDARNNFVLSTGFKLLDIMCFYLIFSRCDQALSLDRWIGARLKKMTVPAPIEPGNIVAQRLIQIQLVLVYWSAVTYKLSGHHWLDGTAVYYVMHTSEVQRFAVPYLFDQTWCCTFFTWATIAVEALLCALIWVKELRYPVMALGLILHAGLEWTVVVPLLQHVMVASYITFVEPADLSRIMRSVKRLMGRQ